MLTLDQDVVLDAFEQQYRSYRVQITRDPLTRRVPYFGTAFPWDRQPEPVDWDGRGVALVRDELLHDLLDRRRPQMCDELRVDGHDYVVIGQPQAWQHDGVRVLRASREAHALARWLLCYDSDRTARMTWARAMRRWLDEQTDERSRVLGSDVLYTLEEGTQWR